MIHRLRTCYRAGFAGAFVDREVESKGLDFIDRERAKRDGTCKLVSVFDSMS